MRLIGLASVSVIALALSASCAPLSATPLPGPADAGGDAGISGEGGSSSGSGGSADSGACAPGDVATYQPVYHPAAPVGGCSDMQQITGFYDACFGPHKTAAGCGDFQTATKTADCARCIVTPDSAMAYGPIVDHGAFVTANVAGCIELMVDSSVGAEPGCVDAGAAVLACAKAAQASDGCELAACEANCNVHDAASLTAYEACAAAADGSGCSMYAQAAQCASPDAGGGSCGPPAACLVTDFKAFYDGVVRTFCLLPPAIDAGAPLDAGGAPPDAAAGD